MNLKGNVGFSERFTNFLYFLLYQEQIMRNNISEVHLNQCVPSIKFETDISDTQVHFLDVTVRLDNDNHLITTSLYTKPTDAHNYLSFKSCHPRNCKSAIPYSQFLRIRRICSDTDDFVFHARQMTKHFLKAQYPSKILQEAFSRAYHLDRNTLLQPKQLVDDDHQDDNLF